MSDSLREALRKLVYRIRQRSTNKLHNREYAMTLDDCVRELAALSAQQADAEADQLLTPRRFLDDILSACDISNWDADRNKGDYFRGLNDAYEAIQEIAIEYQCSICAWCKAHTAPPSQSAEMRKALEALDKVEEQMAAMRPLWRMNLIRDHLKEAREALSRAGDGKESEGGSPAAYVPETEEEANELADNGRNTGGKSYYRPSDPTPPDREAIADIVAERRRQREAEGWTSEHDDDHDKGEMAFAAACYAAPERIFVAREIVGRGYEPFIQYVDAWKWADHWWKPKDRRRDLVRAGALIVAEIERLDRRALQRGGQ